MFQVNYFTKISFFILESRAFAIVEKGYYSETSIVVKKLHTGTTADVTNVIMKEEKFFLK